MNEKSQDPVVTTTIKYVETVIAMVDAGETLARDAKKLGRAVRAYGRAYVAAMSAGLRDPFWMLLQHEHPVVTSLRALDGLVEPTPEP